MSIILVGDSTARKAKMNSGSPYREAFMLGGIRTYIQQFNIHNGSHRVEEYLVTAVIG